MRHHNIRVLVECHDTSMRDGGHGGMKNPQSRGRNMEVKTNSGENRGIIGVEGEERKERGRRKLG